MGESLKGKGEGGDARTGGREGAGYSPCGLGLKPLPRQIIHGRIPPLPPLPAKPSPLPFRRDCSNPRTKVGDPQEKVPSLPSWKSRRWWGVGRMRIV